jgi:AcrR family transcriptional regulator
VGIQVLKSDLRTTDTKERVIEEARRLYFTGGYSYLNLDAIARTLKITRPALYFHFPGGKEQLLQSVIESFGAEIIDQLQVAMTDCTGVREKFRRILLYVANKPLIDNRELCMAELEELSLETRRKLKEVFLNMSEVITGIVKDGISGGELRQVDPPIAVFSFMNLCQQIETFVNLRRQLPHEMGQRFPERVEDMIDALLDLWFDGITSGPAR